AAMFDYTSANPTQDIFIALEQISFLKAALPRLPNAPSRVAYTLEGKRVTRSLDHGDSLALTLSPKQLGALDLRVEAGTVGVTTSYLAPLQAKDVRADRDATITRSLNGVAEGTLSLNDGDLVRVEIPFELGAKALAGCYQISDLLPSGLRAVERPYDRGIEDHDVAYPYAIDGQRVSFCVEKDVPYHSIVYYARVIGAGTYTVEPAIIQAQRGPERVSLTGSMTVRVS